MVRGFRSIKRKENKRKEKSTLKYTMSPSPLPGLGIEDGSYFTILKKSIYNCQKKMGLIPKKLNVDFTKEKTQSSVSCHDLELISRPGFLSFALVQLRPDNFSCDLIPCSCLE